MPRSREEIRSALALVRGRFEKEFGIETSFDKVVESFISTILTKREMNWLLNQMDHLSSLDLAEALAQIKGQVVTIPPKRVSDPGKPGRRRLYDEKK